MDLEKHDIIVQVFSKLDRLLDQRMPLVPSSHDLSSNQAFLWRGDVQNLRPVKRTVRIAHADLLSIEQQKQAVLENTRIFLSGQKANNVLLWGERGTGKSSLIKSLLTEYASSNFRMIQVLKHDILTIQGLYDVVAENPEYRFVLFIDDLSFEEAQTDYKELKTIMDGGLEQIPDNLLFYATSNRKHLIATRFSDTQDDEVRPSDTIEEKVSLAERFGIRLGFYHMSQDSYLEVVDLYAGKAGVTMDKQELHTLAVRWSLQTGGRNGRIAEQFVRSLG